MRVLGTLLLATLILTSLPVSAHDIGISQAELIEIKTGSYRLQVLAGSNASSLFGSPQLPQQCDFADFPRGVQGTRWRTYEFECEGGLKPDDTLLLPWRRDGIMLTATWGDGSQVSRLFTNKSGLIAVNLAKLRLGSGSVLGAAKRYTSLGIEHILGGYDHLLFVLALLLIVSDGWMLVKTITAFTAAHSITLALATLGLVNFPARPVEAAIALSIVFLAVEIMHARQGRVGLTYRAPWIVAFGFGLLHGFGFAGALSDIGFPQGEIPATLLFFNVGVEIGQLMFVLAVTGLKWLINRFSTGLPGWAEILPAYAIGTMAMFWLMQRLSTMVYPV